MKNSKNIIIVLSLLVLFTSCLTTKQTNLLQDPGLTQIYPEATSLGGEYRIKVGDELSVIISMPKDFTKTESLYRLFTGNNIYGEGNKLRSLAVDPAGNIYFPYVGSIYVLDKTTLDVQTELETRINKEILVEEGCLVHVSLDNRFFSVIGESHAGRFPIAREQLTIYQALSQSGDISPYGDRSKVKVIRQTLNGTIVRTFDLRTTAVVNSDFYYIQPNDVIYIQPLKSQFWGVNSFGSVFAVITTVSSLGITVYNVINNVKNAGK